MSRGLWHADRILCNSQFSVDELRRAGLPAERLVRIPLPARTCGCSPGSRSGTPSRPVRLLYVGRLVRAKGIGDLIEALRILRARGSDPVQLTLVGSSVISSPEDIAAFREQIRQHGLDAHRALGVRRLRASASTQLYAESDAFVMPSYHEGFCMPLIEALSHGLPLLHSDRGAIPETSGGLGLTFAAGQPESLAGCLERFLEASSRTMVPTDRGVLDREEWLRQVSHHLENYTFQSFYDALVPHLDDLMIPVPAQVKSYLSRAWLDAMARAGRPEIRQTSELPPRFISALVETGAVTPSVADRVLKGPHRLSRPAESSPLRRLKAILKRMPLVGAGAYRLKRVLVRHPALYNGLKSRADRCLRLVDRARAALRGERLEQVRGGLTRRLRALGARHRADFRLWAFWRSESARAARWPHGSASQRPTPGRAVDALPSAPARHRREQGTGKRGPRGVSRRKPQSRPILWLGSATPAPGLTEASHNQPGQRWNPVMVVRMR